MPQIIVTADRGDGTVTWRERINASDFESNHFTQQLVQRIGWAVHDAHEVEQDADRHPLSDEPAKHAPVATPVTANPRAARSRHTVTADN